MKMVNYMRLKELRKKHGLTQKQLANALHVAQNTVCNWENGVRQIDTEYIKQLAEYFHVSTDYLLGREDSPVNAQFASDAPSALTPRDNRNYRYVQLSTMKLLSPLIPMNQIKVPARPHGPC